jgi:hypothetical protein
MWAAGRCEGERVVPSATGRRAIATPAVPRPMPASTYFFFWNDARTCASSEEMSGDRLDQTT